MQIGEGTSCPSGSGGGRHETRRILLHVCCAGCAAACIERLRSEGFTVVLFFSNANLSPAEEYARRLADVRRVAEGMTLPLVEDLRDHAAWLESVRGLEREPEKGERCRACFAFNLGRTAERARLLGIPSFTTTLSVSPHKRSSDLLAAGGAHQGFVPIDFKKRGGFQRSVELGRTLGVSRQEYCGCEFSRR